MPVSKDALNARLAQALRLCQSGAFADAEPLCRAIVAQDSAHADAWNMLAAVMQQLDRFEEAFSASEHATNLRPELAPYWLTRGNAAFAAGRLDEAEASLSRAVTLAPQLAQAHFRLGLCRAAGAWSAGAISAYRDALRLAPDVAQIHYCLAETLLLECQWGPAMQSFEAAFVRDPDGVLDRYPGMLCMRYLTFVSLPDFWRTELIRFLQRADVSKARHLDIGLRAFKAQAAARRLIEQGDAATGWPTPAPSWLAEVMHDELLHILLCDVVIADAQMERALAGLRTALLLDPELRAQTPLAFACALAMQCFNNEFVYAESAAETAAIGMLRAQVLAGLDVGAVPVDARPLAVLAMYRTLHELPHVEDHLQRLTDPACTQWLKRTVTDVVTERGLRVRMASLEAIGDDTSRAVRDMYEQNPYPRWFSFDRFAPVPLPQWISSGAAGGSAGNGAPARTNRDVVRILVAGCGTGKEACELAVNIAGAQVEAIDLSLSSLAYAQRAAHEVGIDNIVFRQADLLDLGTPASPFDLVSSSGVLHHLKDPEAGLRALVRQVRPGGLLRIALYSERGRAVINLARAAVKERNIQPGAAAIRTFRQSIHALPPDAPMKALSALADFYSLSSCRDLVFHVMEHQFRLPQIETMLCDAGLVVLDLVEGLGPDVTAEYRRRFPDDPGMLSFHNWDVFEQARPDTFAQMVSIRCRVPGGAGQSAQEA